METHYKEVNFQVDNSLIIVKWYYGYRLNDKYIPLNFSTGLNISSKDWDQELKRVKVKPKTITPKEAITINKRLDDIQDKIHGNLEYYRRIGILPTPTELKDAVQKETLKKARQETYTEHKFEDYIDTYFIKKSGYPPLKDKLILYQKAKKKKLTMEKFDMKDHIDFIDWVSSTIFPVRGNGEDYLSSVTITNIKKGLKAVLIHGSKNKVELMITPQDLKVPKYAGDSSDVYVTPERLEQLYNTDFGEQRYDHYFRDKVIVYIPYERVKELFLIAATTGVRFQDWSRLGNIKTELIKGVRRNYIEVTPKKTIRNGVKIIKIPVYQPVMDIYQKYKGSFPKPTDITLFNLALKEIGRMLGWKEAVQDVKIRNGVPVFASAPFYTRLGSHTGRRSFCTNAYYAGVDPKVIIQCSGHSTVEMLMAYVKANSIDGMEEFDNKIGDTFNFKKHSKMKVLKKTA